MLYNCKNDKLFHETNYNHLPTTQCIDYDNNNSTASDRLYTAKTYSMFNYEIIIATVMSSLCII